PFPGTSKNLTITRAYFHSTTTLNYVRSQLAAGYADLHHAFDWSLIHVRDSEVKERYLKTVSSLTDSLDFLRTVGADNDMSIKVVDFYISHEALALEYEQSLTRRKKVV